MKENESNNDSIFLQDLEKSLSDYRLSLQPHFITTLTFISGGGIGLTWVLILKQKSCLLFTSTIGFILSLILAFSAITYDTIATTHILRKISLTYKAYKAEKGTLSPGEKPPTPFEAIDMLLKKGKWADILFSFSILFSLLAIAVAFIYIYGVVK